MGFPTKNDHFGVFGGYHYLRKHPCNWVVFHPLYNPGPTRVLNNCSTHPWTSYQNQESLFFASSPVFLSPMFLPSRGRNMFAIVYIIAYTISYTSLSIFLSICLSIYPSIYLSPCNSSWTSKIFSRIPAMLVFDVSVLPACDFESSNRDM